MNKFNQFLCYVLIGLIAMIWQDIFEAKKSIDKNRQVDRASTIPILTSIAKK